MITPPYCRTTCRAVAASSRTIPGHAGAHINQAAGCAVISGGTLGGRRDAQGARDGDLSVSQPKRRVCASDHTLKERATAWSDEQNESTCDVPLTRVSFGSSAFLRSCSLPAVSSASSLQPLVKATQLERRRDHGPPGAARDRSSADAGVLRSAPAGRLRADRRSSRSCSTTPASWRTTPRSPHNPTSMCRLPRISARSSTILCPTRPCCTTA